MHDNKNFQKKTASPGPMYNLKNPLQLFTANKKEKYNTSESLCALARLKLRNTCFALIFFGSFGSSQKNLQNENNFLL